MKKTLVTFIIIAVALVACMTTVEAASFGVKITPSATEVKKGETVTLVVSVNNLNLDGQGLTALYGVIDYDTTVFNTLNAETDFKALNGWDTPTFNASNNKILTAKGGYVTTDSDVFEVTLTVKETANTGSTTVTLKNITGSDNESDIAVANVSCALQIADKTTGGTGGDGTATSKPTVTASYEKVANGVKVTLTSDKELKSTAGWELSSNKKQLTRVYTANYSGTITVEDVDGNKSDAITLNVEVESSGDNDNSGTTEDKTAPTASVKYTKGTNGVTVTVTASEEIKAVTGWTLSSDKKTLTRVFAADYTGTITLEDLSGNKSQPIEIKVDMSNPNGGTDVDNAGDTNQSDTNNNSSTATDSLPKAGTAYIIPVIALIAVIGVGAYIRYKSMEY